MRRMKWYSFKGPSVVKLEYRICTIYTYVRETF
jgi:hypothetical protein